MIISSIRYCEWDNKRKYYVIEIDIAIFTIMGGVLKVYNTFGRVCIRTGAFIKKKDK